MFWAWVQDRLTQSLSLRPRLADIQELNQRALTKASWGLTKVSAATYLEPEVQSNYRLLSSGAALGRACGPLVISKEPWSSDSQQKLRVAIPGRNTTAFQLAKMAFQPWVQDWVELRYDRIMPAVLSGEVEAGVIIHESRFSYQQLGLKLAMDLGEWWETKTGLPLPLGVMVARKDLSDEIVEQVETTLRDSIAKAWTTLERPTSDPTNEALWQYMRSNAVEMEDTTILNHVKLYVNPYSLDLGEEGRQAISTFGERAGLNPAD